MKASLDRDISATEVSCKEDLHHLAVTSVSSHWYFIHTMVKGLLGILVLNTYSLCFTLARRNKTAVAWPCFHNNEECTSVLN